MCAELVYILYGAAVSKQKILEGFRHQSKSFWRDPADDVLDPKDPNLTVCEKACLLEPLVQPTDWQVNDMLTREHANLCLC